MSYIAGRLGTSWKIFICIVALIIVVFLIREYKAVDSEIPANIPKKHKTSNQQSSLPGKSQDYSIPKEAIQTYEYAIENNGEARPGFRGNTKFGNREKLLPSKKGTKTLSYKEYDIYPFVKGKNRGPKRVVISSDKTGYYTSDHYRTFKQINR